MSERAKVLVIAEAGVNHNGELELAHRLVDIAADAGADLVKFQTFKASSLVTPTARIAEYQKKLAEENLGASASNTQWELLRKLELGERDHESIIEHCQVRGIGFLSTAFDLESLQYLAGLELPLFKIPSGEITNLPYLRKVASYGRETILSTGMATLGEVEAAINAMELAGLPREKITVLQCTTEYPAPIEEVNLLAMRTMGAAFGVKIGYSDHTEGIEVALAAVAMGASVIEKHFTIDRHLPGPDHMASLEPDELMNMVQSIRRVQKALGSSIKKRTRSEEANLLLVRKSIVAARTIKKGELFSEENLIAKRPASGLSPMTWDELIGKTAPKSFEPDEVIQL